MARLVMQGLQVWLQECNCLFIARRLLIYAVFFIILIPANIYNDLDWLEAMQRCICMCSTAGGTLSVKRPRRG